MTTPLNNVYQQALHQIIHGAAGRGESPLSTFSHGLVDVDGNIILLVNDQGVLVNGDGTAILIYGEPIAISNVTGLQAELDSLNGGLTTLLGDFNSLAAQVANQGETINTVSSNVSDIQSTLASYGDVVTKNIGTTGGTVPDGADSRFTQIVNIASFPVSPIQLAFNHTLITATLVDNTTKSIEIDNGANGDVVSFSFLGAGSTGGSVTITDGGSFSTTVSSLRSGDYAFISLTRNNGSWHKNYLAINGSSGSSPAGTGTELQYRNGSILGAIPGTSWNGGTNTLQLPNLVTGDIDTGGSTVKTSDGNINVGAGNILIGNASVIQNGDAGDGGFYLHTDAGSVRTAHFQCDDNFASPSSSAGSSSGSGGAAAVSSDSGDMAGRVTVGVVSPGVGGNTICSVHFNRSFSGVAHVVLCPISEDAVAAPVYVTTSDSGFDINAKTGSTIAIGTYIWDYIVFGGRS